MKRQVSASRAGDKIQAMHDKIEDARVSGKSLIEAAKAVGLTAQSIPAVDAQGEDPKGAPVNLPDKTELLRAAFASDVGVDEAPLHTKDGGFVWFMITKIDPAHDLTFEEAKPEVETAMARRGGRQGARRQGGRSGQAAQRRSERRATSRRAPARRRNRPPTSTATSKPACRRRSWPRSSASLPTARGRRPTPDGRMVFKITADRTPPVDFADARVKAMASQLDASTRESLLDQYVDGVAPRARRRRPSGRPAIRRGQLTADDHPARL